MTTILVDNGTYALQNMGDVIMLQACVARLRDLFPAARIGVLTCKPERLARYCPDALPVDHVGRDQFITPGAVLGKLHKLSPDLETTVRRSIPSLAARVALARARRRKLNPSNIPGFVELLRSADLIVAAGGGYITDQFPWLAERILRTVLLAQAMGKPTAMLGQGLGPIEDPGLRSLAARALAGLDVLALREGRANHALLASLGVSASRAVVTGDDAIETALRHAPKTPGNGLGVNLRTTRYSGAGADTVATLRPILRGFAASRGAPLVPVPISYNDDAEDVRVLRQLLERDDLPAEDVVQTPEHSVAAAASCRVVVTGAYHAAVFALSTGVPAIALAGSEYYVNKFEGLRAQFGGHLDIVRMDRDGWTADLRARLDAAWSNAEFTRPALLAAAARQAQAGRDAYRQLANLIARPRPSSAA